MNSTCPLTVDLRNSSNLFLYLYLPNEWILYEIVWPCIILFGFTGNIMFIWTVKRVPSLHTSTFIFLASLAITDTFVLVSVSLDFIPDFLMTPIRYGDDFIVSMIYFFTSWFCFFSSLFFITLVSLERYLAICHPIKHHLLKGKKRTIKLIGVVLVGTCILASAVFPAFAVPLVICIVWPLDDKFISNYPQVVKLLQSNAYSFAGVFTQITQSIAVGSFVAAFVANFYFYIKILQKLKKRKCNKTLQTSASSERNIRQASVMVIANGIIFYFCFTVFLVTMNIQLLISFELEIINPYQNIILTDINYTFILINASINPLVYFITNNTYRHAFKQNLWMCIRGQQHKTTTPTSISIAMQGRL